MNEKIAYVQSQIACALIEMEAMKTVNDSCKMRGEVPFYCESDFLNLQNKYGICHNIVLTALYE
jgi:hypothetical protein